MKNIIIANWKMNQELASSKKWFEFFLSKISDIQGLPEIAICPPYVYLHEISNIIANNNKILLASQDISFAENGAYTGDISAKMIADFSCRYCLIGHSERRQFHFETNENLAKKLRILTGYGVTPVFCIGESFNDRKRKTYVDFLRSQIDNVIPKDVEFDNFIVAYEPIWSIGTGLIPEISAISEIVNLIYEQLSKYKNIKNCRVVYGGSVKSSNSKDILAIKNISGLLVGSSSLDYEEFFKIISSNG